MAKRIDGKMVAEELRATFKDEVEELKLRTGIEPGLAVILVGEDPASQIYVRNKESACKKAKIQSFAYRVPEYTTEEEILMLIDTLNEDDAVHGILCQLPLPAHMDTQKILDRIDPKKDVDGFHPLNVGRLVLGRDCLMPCTPAGVMELLKYYEIDPAGKHCVIVGRSTLVGKPLIQMMLSKNATVTVAHSKTEDLEAICKTADILVAAVGVEGLITRDHIKPGAVVIDVGINRSADGKVRGDVLEADAEELAEFYTPVPGGVGPMTITMLLRNTLTACKAQVRKLEERWEKEAEAEAAESEEDDIELPEDGAYDTDLMELDRYDLNLEVDAPHGRVHNYGHVHDHGHHIHSHDHGPMHRHHGCGCDHDHELD